MSTRSCKNYFQNNYVPFLSKKKQGTICIILIQKNHENLVRRWKINSSYESSLLKMDFIFIVFFIPLSWYFSQPVKVFLNKKLDSMQKTTQAFNLDAQGFKKTSIWISDSDLEHSEQFEFQILTLFRVFQVRIWNSNAWKISDSDLEHSEQGFLQKSLLHL